MRLGVVLAGVVSTLFLTQLALGEPRPATEADRFIESIGVNIHLHYTDTVYWDFDKLRRSLQEMGVRHVRDGLVPSGRKEYFERYRQLGEMGIKATMIVSGDLGKLPESVERLGAAVEAIEGPNEVNLNGWKVEDAQKYQAALWKAVKDNPKLARLPVIGLSYTDAGFGEGLGGMSAWLDSGNAHPYPGGWMPENDCNWMRADLTSGLKTARSTCGEKPVQITEIGYTNALKRPGGHVPVSEQAAGVYLPRIFLNCYRNGVVRTFWYELFDLKPDPERKEVEHNFGLLRNDGTKKPAAWALQHLVQLLADPGPRFQPTSLEFTLSEPKAQTVVFQKRNGQHWVALWLPSSMWDQSRPYGQKQEVDPADAKCRITFAQSPRALTCFSNLDRPEPSKSSLPAGKEVELTISERVQLLCVEQ